MKPKPGYTERDMEKLWEANARVIASAIRKGNIASQDIIGVSLSGHGKGLYLTDEKGRPVYPGILSTDTRAWKYIEKWYQDGTNDKVRELSLQEITVCQPVALLAWMRDNEPQVLQRTRYIFAVKDYIRYKITGEAYAEYTDFSGSNLINLMTGQYDKKLLELFGLGNLYSKLPPLRLSSDICGFVTLEASKKTLLPEGIPVAAGMFDVDACGIASGLCTEKDMCMIAGTWSINEFIRKKPIAEKTVSFNSMFCIPGYYLIEESSPTSAGNMEWFIRNLMDWEIIDAKEKNKNIYDITNEWVASIEPDMCNVVFLPYLNGSGDDALAKGTFVGLTAYHNKRHMLRAVYEGIVFSHFSHVKKLLYNREKPESIRLSGGAANSEVWVQIFSDVIQIPIETVDDKELGAQGAAIAAGIAAGVYKDYRDAIEKTVVITKKFMPRKAYRDIYERKYAVYCAVANHMKNVWRYFEDK